MAHIIQDSATAWQNENDCIHLKACRRMQKICKTRLNVRIPRFCNAAECSCYQKMEVNKTRDAAKKRVQEYNDYLQSDRFNALKMKVFRRDNFQCQICGSGKNLQAHHITYARRGHEHVDDLVTLCAKCHCEVHKNDNANLAEAES